MARDYPTASSAANQKVLLSPDKVISRRQFIKRAAVAGAATVGGATAVGGGKLALDRIWRASELARRDRERPSGESWFTPAEHKVVAALCDIIVPSDETGPGALEAGIVERLDRMVALSSAPRRLYARGLLAFDELANRQRGRGFADLTAKEKIVMIKALERNFQEIAHGGDSVVERLSHKATALYRSWPEGAAANLFATLVEDTMAAFYSSLTAWQSLSYDGPPFSRAYIANFGPCGETPQAPVERPLQS
jgi:gluconate 2-dehydrogenase subunit 3-like protein